VKRSRTRAGAFLVALAFVCLSFRARADPRLEWFTVRTPHFAVHYHGGLENLAQRTASFAEAIRERLLGPMGEPPSHVTHVLLTDNVDVANGSATAIPYNAIRLFVSAPEDLSVLGDYDDWELSLVTHEQTHVFHVDNISGPAVIVNAVLGKTYSPNQVQPRWILEGLAVAMESRLTSGGRLRSSLFDMYLRADVLADDIAGLDQMSHTVWRWPHGDIWYLYGGKFIGYILDTYGPDVYAAVAADYGANLFPWGINRSIHRATGSTYPELYDAWVLSLKAQYGAQVREVKRRGLRVGTQLTHHGSVTTNPRFVPPCAREGAREELLYFKDDGHEVPGFYRLPLESRSRAAEGDAELVARASGSPRTASFDDQCGIVFDSVGPTDRRYSFDDLRRVPMARTPKPGARSGREKWTTGVRARSPDVSPDGRRIVFLTGHEGTMTLRIGDVRPEGGITNARALVPSARGEQAFSPRFSPDGTRVAYGTWTAGGYRDIRVVNLRSGEFYELSHDRALDSQPSWSPDGRHVFFSSDRTGISNVYAYDVTTGKTSQVTNVLSGAFMPEVSPDGRTLVYVGYGHEGFDLYSMPLSPGDWLPAIEPPHDRPEVHDAPAPRQWPVTRYDPWPTLRPHSYELEAAEGVFGNAYTLRTSGSDIAGLHNLYLSLTYHSEVGEFTGSLSYSYPVLPLAFSATTFRSLAPREPVTVDGKTYPLREEAIGVTTGVNWSLPEEFVGHNVALSYTASIHDTPYPIGRVLDPYAPLPHIPSDYFLGSVGMAWSYANVFRPTFGISSERGYSLSVNGDFAGRETGSDATLAAVEVRAIGYALAPWGHHHAFALALSGGAATGSYPGRGYYFTGGYDTEADPVEFILNGYSQGAFLLRGYEPGAFIGRQYNLANLEYRFPVINVDRGISTLPVYFEYAYGALFADYGGAYNELDLDDVLGQYHLGVGAELRLVFTLGYFLSGGLRLGYARGLSEGAIEGGKTYVVVGAAF
jgi:hypothetical protein